MLKKINKDYSVALMAISIAIIGVLVVLITMNPEKSVELGNGLLFFLTHTFGSVTQGIAMIIFIGLIVLALSKYGNVRFGKQKPQFKTRSWVAMMFFTGLGAGTVYWAFLEWGYHFNAAPALEGAAISGDYAYEIAEAYVMYDWGPIAWAMFLPFALPFAYHYYVKEDGELRLSALCKYSLGEKAANGWIGSVVNFLFIFAAVGSICISAGTSASTIAEAIASLFGISATFGLMVAILIGTALVYTISSLVGIEKGMRQISDWNVYFCFALLIFIFLAGNSQYIIDSIINGLGILGSEFTRMTLWTDPSAQTGYPQDWTVFYIVYWLVFAPFTGLFVAKISRGRTVREIIFNMLVTGSSGCIVFFGVVTAYQQAARMEGILDVPQMLTDGRGAEIATATLNTLPFSKFAIVLYLVVIILFLATTLDATSFTLSSTITRKLGVNYEPGKAIKGIWCLILVALPIAMAYIGTDIGTIKSIVLATGLPLILILVIANHGFLKEMFKDFGHMSAAEIKAACAITEDDDETKELETAAE